MSFTPDFDAWLVYADDLEARGEASEALRIRRLALGPDGAVPVWATETGVAIREALRRLARADWVARSGEPDLESTLVGGALRIDLNQFSAWLPRRGSADGVQFGYQGMLLDHLQPARQWLGQTCARLSEALLVRLGSSCDEDGIAILRLRGLT